MCDIGDNMGELAKRRGSYGGRWADVPAAQDFIDAVEGWSRGGMEMGKQPQPSEYERDMAGYATEAKQSEYMRMFLQQVLKDRYKNFYPDAPPAPDPLLQEAERLGQSQYTGKTRVTNR